MKRKRQINKRNKEEEEAGSKRKQYKVFYVRDGVVHYVKYVYSFGGGCAEGNATMKNLLGGKGANLAEMAKIGLPVPAGFTLTTEVCTAFSSAGDYPSGLHEEVIDALKHVETHMKPALFGDAENPFLVSCRSGARQSMPGMMETVLNVGLTSKSLPGLIKKTGSARFAYDSYRRLIMMYSDVVMEKAEDVEPVEEDGGIRVQLERIMSAIKKKKGYESDSDLKADDLKLLCDLFKKKVREVLGSEFPDDPYEQLWGAIGAVFKSWDGKRAVSYRRIEGIPDNWGTACSVQAMVFGNAGSTDSATGVAFTRNPATGENKFYGEWLPDAQGEDVVAGIRTPNPLNEETKNDQNKHLPSLQKAMPKLYSQLVSFRNTLETHYHDMQDIEFTIQEGKLFMLQCRNGKRTGTAALNMAMDMLDEKLVDTKTAITRMMPSQVDELMHPNVDSKAEAKQKPFAKGLPAGPGAAVGQIVFTSNDAVKWAKEGKKVILLREETNPEDVEGMRAACGILTARGGMTSHAALVARGWGKCCVVGAGMLDINLAKKTVSVGKSTFKEGDVFTLNGSRGTVFPGTLPLIDATENPNFSTFMKMAMDFRKMGVRANADNPADAKKAREFGALGIGLFRVEHMFYGKGSEEPLFLLRKMILSNTTEERKAALAELFPFMKKDFKATIAVMDGYPITFRLLDPPLHEFVPQNQSEKKKLASNLGISIDAITQRGEALHESNPMMGHRGVRLGLTYPEISEMQIRALFEASGELMKEGKNPQPELMVPLTVDVNEVVITKEIVDRVQKEVSKKLKLDTIPLLYGTMIETPRACLAAEQIATIADFFSFGTNDLTQMTFGFSRDDAHAFLPAYLDQDVLPGDPFGSLDKGGVCTLIDMAVNGGRKTKPNLKIGICGEHGGDPASVEFCYSKNFNYVSCSPYRVPVAIVAAARSEILSEI